MSNAPGSRNVRRRLTEESGYSLVEVLAAIMILSLAIIPMVGMFDAGLRAAATGGNFDKARALANEELENIRALPYYERGTPPNSAREFYPPVNGPVPGSPVACRATPLPSGITSCQVTTNFVRLDNAGVVADPDVRNMMSMQVTVAWGNGDYEAVGLISQETG